MKYEVKKQVVAGMGMLFGLFVLLAGAAPVWGEELIDIYNPGVGGAGWSFANNVVTIAQNGDYTISGYSKANRVVVASGVTATVTLHGAIIESASGGSPLALGSSAIVTLRLVNTNTLTATNEGTTNPAAGLQVEEPSQLTIEEGASGGSLTVTGAGYTPYKSAATDAWGGAGIGSGGSTGSRAGRITIRSGTITATGGENAAGIGGSGYSANIGNQNLGAIYNAKVQSFGGNITIEGGTVTARGGEGFGGAAIGGGLFGNADITISGGTVYAYAPNDLHGALSAGADSWTANAAAIGSGAFVGSSNITITGGEVYAFSYKGAAIGSGGSMYNVAYYPVNNGNISITGGTVVAKSSIGYGDPAAIGGGSFMQAGTINISGGIIYAVGDGLAGGIGSGTLHMDIPYYDYDNNTYGTADKSSLTITNGTIIASMVGKYKGSNLSTAISGSHTLIISPTINEQTLMYSVSGATIMRDALVAGGGRDDMPDASVKLLSDTTIDGHWPLNIPANVRLTVPTNVSFDVNHHAITVEGEFFATGGYIINNEYVTYAKILQNSWIDAIPEQTYTGGKIEPTITVRDNSGVTLMRDKDYTVTYFNNTEPGLAIVNVVGAGQYSGTATANFTIVRQTSSITLLDAWVRNIPDQTYTGYTISPKPEIHTGAKLLTENTDYTLDYSNNENAGTANIHITGKGEYTGTLTKPFNILRKMIDASWLTPIPDQYYTGLPIEPVITLRDPNRDTTLIRTQDYTAKCTNNTNEGTATITIDGQGNYQGTLSAKFSIIRKPPHTVIIVSMLSDLVKANTSLSPDIPYFQVTNDSAFVLMLKITGNNVTVLAPPELTVNGEKADFIAIPEGQMYYSNLTIDHDLLIQISGMSITTAAETPRAGLTATADSHGIHLRGLTVGQTLELYDPTGQLLYKTTATTTNAFIPLTRKGAYLIIAGDSALKAVF